MNSKSLYQHALDYFTDRFGCEPVAQLPPDIECIGVDLLDDKKVLAMEPADFADRIGMAVWANLCGAVAHRGLHVSMWQPMWSVVDSGRHIGVTMITEPDAMKVAEAVARMEVTHIEEPFAGREPQGQLWLRDAEGKNVRPANQSDLDELQNRCRMLYERMEVLEGRQLRVRDGIDTLRQLVTPTPEAAT